MKTAEEHRAMQSSVTAAADLGRVETSGLIRALIAKRKIATKPSKPLPLRRIPSEELADRSEAAVYRLGHSTVLIRLDGEYFLTDPVFCSRAFPVQWLGPKRFQPTPLAIDELPAIEAVVISHDHYDHLDESSIRHLSGKVDRFLVPTGVGRRLRKWGVAPDKIEERGWWQSVSVGSVTFTAAPTQHFTGRTPFDRNQTVAASWVVDGAQGRMFFGGDSGYFDGFREIADRFGGFDLTMLENGAYSPFWKPIHMTPEETLRAHLDLKGKRLMPIHNGTFDLSFHEWFEPMERLQHLAEANSVSIATPMFGQPLLLGKHTATEPWWRSEMTDASD